MNDILTRKLAATATAPVVRLDSKWVSDGSWPKHLRKRANASVSFLLAKYDRVLFDDLAVGFLAERTDTMTVSGPDGCERWAIVAIRYPDMRYRFAVRCTAWEKHPPLPGLGLTDREVELVYIMCDELSRRKAYADDVFDVADELFDNIDDNVQIAQELGDFDEQRFLALLKMTRSRFRSSRRHSSPRSGPLLTWSIFRRSSLTLCCRTRSLRPFARALTNIFRR